MSDYIYAFTEEQLNRIEIKCQEIKNQNTATWADAYAVVSDVLSDVLYSMLYGPNEAGFDHEGSMGSDSIGSMGSDSIDQPPRRNFSDLRSPPRIEGSTLRSSCCAIRCLKRSLPSTHALFVASRIWLTISLSNCDRNN